VVGGAYFIVCFSSVSLGPKGAMHMKGIRASEWGDRL